MIRGLLLLFLLVVPFVAAWGPVGHSALANAAFSLMSSQAQKKASSMLGGSSFGDVANEADKFANSDDGKWSKTYHYVNMNKGETQYNPNTDCDDPGCVVSSLLNYSSQIEESKTATNILLGKVGSYSDVPSAIEFVIHFVGDIHQPFHVGWLVDKGGNTIKCTFFGKKCNLHQVWDSDMIERVSSDVDTWTQTIQDIVSSNSSLVDFYTRSMNPADWADESFSFVQSGEVYDYNPSSSALRKHHGHSGHSNGGNQGNDDSDSGECEIGSSYQNHNMPIVKERLVASAIRLAALLNKVFTDSL